ncbi:hypothetical protein AX14_011434 [Amanita brunnescens Koide BX004]|nr:hypothetical protein AX14_011434 [Amanita brunnescens Koide BX004]
MITDIHLQSLSNVCGYHSSVATLVMHRRALLDTITNLTSRQSSDAFISEYDGNIPIPWSEWGPPISRWFVNDSNRPLILAMRPPVSAGQRWAVLDPDDHDYYRISIIDFNPYNMHNVPSDLPGKFVIEQPGTLSSCDVFAENIQMGLGCTRYTTSEVYDFNKLLMDEERLVGVKMTVFHFG